MSSVKPTNSSSSGAVAPQRARTSTPKSSDSDSAPANSSRPSAQETKSSQQLATAKKEEFGLSQISKTLNNVLDGVKQLGETIIKDGKDLHQNSVKTDQTDQTAVEDLRLEKFFQPGLTKYGSISLVRNHAPLKRGDSSDELDELNTILQVEVARRQMQKLNDLLIKNLTKPVEAMADITKPAKKSQMVEWKTEKQVDEAREQLSKLNDLLIKNIPKPDETMADTTKPVKKSE